MVVVLVVPHHLEKVKMDFLELAVVVVDHMPTPLVVRVVKVVVEFVSSDIKLVKSLELQKQLVVSLVFLVVGPSIHLHLLEFLLTQRKFLQ